MFGAQSIQPANDTVAELEDIMFGVQSIQPANDNDGLFPWEREEVYKPAKQEDAKSKSPVMTMTVSGQSWTDI